MLDKLPPLLGVSGFTAYSAGQIKKYWYHKSGLTKRQQQHVGELKEQFSESLKQLSKPERLVVGKYIGLLQKVSFDTGLRMGLTTFLQENIEAKGK